MKNSINLLALGTLLIGVFVIGLAMTVSLNPFFTMTGFAGGLILVIVETKFLFDRLNGK